MAERLARLLPALWAGLLLAIAVVAAPAAFAALPSADAGRVVGRMFIQEAWASLALAAVLLLLLRARGGSVRAGLTPLLWGTVACTVLGYFAVQPLMAAARAGQGALSFGQLHLISTVFYGVKTLLVLGLAWRTAAPDAFSRRPSS